MTPERLLAHLDDGRAWPADVPSFTDMPQAYRLALAVRALRVARGERPCGYKIGFTNRTLWPRYGVFAPMWGTVWDRSVRLCEGEGGLTLAPSCQPRIEPEAVFGIAHTPPAQASLQQLFEALDWIAPGFEIVQSHRPEWKFSAADTAADGGLHARLLVGARRPLRALAPDAAALHALLAREQVALRRDGQTVETGRGAHVLDSPLAALHHFLQELRRTPGAADLQGGDVVTTGTWTDAWPVQPGQRWEARFDGVLGSLRTTLD